MSKFLIHFDGSCWVNPGGTAAYGVVVEKEHLVNGAPYTWTTVCEEAGVIGTGPGMSNNLAEFHALLTGLRRYVQHGVRLGDKIEVRGDSNLVIQVMNGRWSAKSDKLYYETYRLVKDEVDFLKTMKVEFKFIWIPREENTRCDILSKEHNNAAR